MDSKKPLFSEYCCYVLGILAMCAQGRHIFNRHLRDIGMIINGLIEPQTPKVQQLTQPLNVQQLPQPPNDQQLPQPPNVQLLPQSPNVQQIEM
jgi:hypothetical protein